MRKLSTVHLIRVVCFVEENIMFSVSKAADSKLVNTRWTAVLSLPLQYGFSA